MNKIRKFFRNHYGPSVKLKYRMFCICSVLGTITSFLGAVLCCSIAGLQQPVSYATVLAFIMMMTLTTIGHMTRKPDTILIIMSSFLNFIIFPAIFLSTGGLYSIAPMFFVMGIFIAIPILSKRKRNILFLIQLIYYSGIISLCFIFPDLSYLRPQKVHTIMLLFSFIIVTFYTVFSTIMITTQYEKEQTKVRVLNRLLEKQAILDPLTKLYNRRYLDSFLTSRLQESSSPFLIILIDIDDFKKVNDTHGHVVGDAILISLARSLKEIFPEDCFTCRYGGEEFLVYCSTPDMKLAEYRIDLVRKLFSKLCQKQFSITVTFSAGGVIYQGERDINILINRADALLYQAKKSGKNKFLHHK